MGVLLGRVTTSLCDVGKPRGGGSSERVVPLGNEGGVAPQKIAGSGFCAPQKIAAFPLKCVLLKIAGSGFCAPQKIAGSGAKMRPPENSGYSHFISLFYFFLSKMRLNSHFISTYELCSLFPQVIVSKSEEATL